MRGFDGFLHSERGASEVAGAALLIGMVATAMMATLVIGGAALDQVEAQNDQEQASMILQEMDSRFSTLSSGGDDTQMTLDLGETNPSDFRVEKSGFLNVTVNERVDCSANITLSSIRHVENGQTVGYEAGGVWRNDASNGSTMLTSPSVSYRAGTIDLHVVNVSGHMDAARNTAALDVGTSRTKSSEYNERLFEDGCERPNNVTLSVQSNYYRAWGSYLETEFGGSVSTFDHNRTAKVFLTASDLPERVNDDENNVVNLSDSSRATVDPVAKTISFDKGAGNVYSVSVVPMTGQQPDIGEISDIEDATNVTRTPLDVMFVFDESGSMDYNDGDSTTRMEEAQSASQGFLGDLNDSMDRAGIVSFDTDGYYHLTRGGDGNYITGDFDALNDTIDTLRPNGGTQSQHGIRYGNNVFELRSNETRDRVMVLLSDGMNNDCQGTGQTNDDDPFDCGGGPSGDNRLSAERADDAAANGVSIYTIGYGDESAIDQGLLKELADRTDGSYHHAQDADELDQVFEDIVEEISQTKTIALTPVSSNYTSASGEVYAPQAAGSMDHVAKLRINGNDFANINDPTAGSQFTHSFAISDGETVEMEAYDYDCEEWRGTGRSKRGPDGEVYNVVRCTDVTSEDSLSPDEIYLDGDNVAPLLREDEGWWQQDINATFDSHNEIVVNRTGGSNFGELSLESNQALVYWDLPDGSESSNRLLMLYEIGLSEEDADTSGVINVQVSSVDLSD